MAGVRLGATALRLGVSALALGAAAAEPSALAEVSVSYYPLSSDPYTDMGNGCNGYGEVKVSGANYRTHTLYQEGYLQQDGTCTTFPSGTTQISSTEFISNGFAANPDYYVGRTLVFERYQGKFIGSGNSYAPNQLGAATLTVDVHLEQNEDGDGSTTVFTFTDAAGWAANQIHVYVGGYLQQHKLTPGTDYTVADNGSDLDVTFATPPASGTGNIYFLLSRKEYALDPASWGGDPPRAPGCYYVVTIGTAAAISNYRPLSIFFKDEEARHRARFTNPKNFFATWFENYFDFAKYMRPMDAYMPMNSNASVPADMALLTDGSISTITLESHYTDYDFGASGVGMRQANPLVPHLDLCKNAYDEPHVPHVTLPCYFGYPFYITTQSTYLQSSGATEEAYMWLKPTVVDFGEAVTLTSQSPSGAFTLDNSNRRLVIDASLATTNNEEFSVTVNFTDVEGVSRAYVQTFRAIEISTGNFHMWPKLFNAWVDNETYYDGHWCWAQWADWFLDQLEAVSWSSSDEILLELGNEVWNFARRFDAHTTFSQGCGSVKSLGGDFTLSGHGWIYGKFKKALDDRMTARALSFNITMAIGTWTAYSVSATTGDITNEKLSGFKQYYESTEGGELSGSPLAAVQAKAQVFMTNYFAGPFHNLPDSNMSGLSDTANSDYLIALFDAGEEDFWAAVYDWYADTEAGTGAGNNIYNRVRWIEYKYDGHQTVAEAYNTIVRGSYEGGSHDDETQIPLALRTHTGFAASYYSHMQGATGAAIWALIVSRMRAKDPNFIVTAYGGPYSTAATDFNQPWQYGAYQASLNGYATAIRETA